MELIGKISGIDDAQPMTIPFEVMTSALRPDIPEKPTPVSDIIKNAAHTEDNQIKVPKVVG
jgi:aspartyl/glutamyl-tRNA(Asn/Gln) amidotransferase C subunit